MYRTHCAKDTAHRIKKTKDGHYCKSCKQIVFIQVINK